MPIRWAAAVGAAIIAATIGAFLFIPQHQIAGSNNFARLAPFITLPANNTVCLRLPGVPGGAGYVRIGVANGPPEQTVKRNNDRSSFGKVEGIKVAVEAAGAPVDTGRAFDFTSGRKDVPLERPTEPAGKGRICVTNLGTRVLSLYGEPKKGRDGVYGPKLAVTFLEADKTSFASRLRLIARRYGYAHAGVLGSWAVAFAALVAAAMAGLALWLVYREVERS